MKVSNHVRLFDDDLQHLNGEPMQLRTFEAVIEAIYEAHVMPSSMAQPFFQYTIRSASRRASATRPCSD
jgi:carbohydrate-selective porin (OprB family)